MTVNKHDSRGLVTIVAWAPVLVSALFGPSGSKFGLTRTPR